MTTQDVITQVAFATGRILHQGTGEPVIGEIQITAKEGPVVDKVLADGTFAISGDLKLLFPHLDTQNYQLNLTIRANTAQYRAGFINHTLLVAIPGGSNFDPDPPLTLGALVDIGTILLPADSINIRGRVVEAKNPDTPISGATVEVLHAGPPIPAATTKADGGYRFDDITVTAPARIRCSEPMNFKPETRTLLIDFGKLVNEESFRLPPLI